MRLEKEAAICIALRRTSRTMIQNSKWTLSLALAAAMVTAVPAFSQQTQAPNDGQQAHEGHHKGRHDRMAKVQERLKLTPEQMEKIKPILQEQRTKVQALRESANQNTDRAALRSQMQTIHQETEAKLQGVLTAEQFQEWKNLRAEGKGRGWKHRGGNQNQNQ
jgi:periplasmic protein CpxP/Spy